MPLKSRKKRKYRPRDFRRAVVRFILKLLIAILLVSGLALGVTIVQIWWLKDHNPHRTSWMKMRLLQGRAKKQKVEIKYTWVSLKTLPNYVPAAIIAGEDDGFYTHRGFDWEAIKKAAEHNQRKGRIRRGGSTITQQLAKNLFLSPDRTYIRKVREAIITYFLERILTKQRILELYLNVIEFGPYVFGIEEGAKWHFKVSARNLTVEQACLLAAIIPAPLKYKVNGNYVIKRAERIKRNLNIFNK